MDTALKINNCVITPYWVTFTHISSSFSSREIGFFNYQEDADLKRNEPPARISRIIDADYKFKFFL